MAQGAHPSPLRVLRHLRRFEFFQTGGIDFAATAARNYRHFRARGRRIRKTIDCLIATFCIEQHHTLLHNNRDCDAFKELLDLQATGCRECMESMENVAKRRLGALAFGAIQDMASVSAARSGASSKRAGGDVASSKKMAPVR